MQVKIDVADRRIVARLEAIGPTVREALKQALLPIVDAMESDAKSRATAHIHTMGTDPGKYLDSIYAGLNMKHETRVIGWLRSGSPLAHLLEFGAQTPAHDILASIGSILANETAGEVWGRLVHSPGAIIPAYPAIFPALEAQRETIETTLKEAVNSTTAAF